MTFGPRTATATISPNARGVWLAHEPLTARFSEEPSNGAGESIYTSNLDIKPQSIWIVVDGTTGAIQADSPTAGLAASNRRPVSAVFARDEAGQFTRITVPIADAVDLIWVRPGVGSWYLSMWTPGLVDLDGLQDGSATFSAQNFRFLGRDTFVPTPATFAATDIIAGEAWDLHYFAGDVRPTVTGPGTLASLTISGSTVYEGGVTNARIARVDGWDAATFTYSGVGIVPGTISFGGGIRVKDFSLQSTDDHVWSGSNGSGSFQLYAPDGSKAGTPFIFPLIENDLPPAISLETASVREGDAAGQHVDLTLRLTGQSTLPASISFAPGFFTPVSSAPVIFAPGETSRTVAFTYNGDKFVQGDRTVALSVATYTDCSPGSFTVKVLDDDTLPSITPGDASASESGGTMKFPIRFDTPAPTDVTIRVDTVSGTAIEGRDFAGLHRYYYILKGEDLTVEVPLIKDSIQEEGETFSLVVSSPVGATLSRTTATGTILDTPAVSIADVRVTEGNSATSQVKVRISVVPVSSEPVVLRFATVDDSATTGSDYLPRNATTTIPAGASGVTETFTIVGDDVIEPDETFRIVLSSVTGAFVDHGTATVTIVDDDSPTPVVSIDDAVAIETNSGATAATFRLHLDRPSTDPVTVMWSASDGTASSPDDYAMSGGSVTFAPGQLEAAIVVIVKGDTIVEPDEDFFVTLTAPVNARLGNESAHGLILNDDGLRRGRVAGH
ncbi:MAG: large repetitive protein [Acidobacteriota bacterium]|nr:large repetitive protein [Acidobacteriota bacterium]